MHANQPAGAAMGHTPAPKMLHDLSSRRGLRHFRDSASCSADFSSVRSASRRFSRRFSFSSSKYIGPRPGTAVVIWVRALWDGELEVDVTNPTVGYRAVANPGHVNAPGGQYEGVILMASAPGPGMSAGPCPIGDSTGQGENCGVGTGGDAPWPLGTIGYTSSSSFLGAVYVAAYPSDVFFSPSALPATPNLLAHEIAHLTPRLQDELLDFSVLVSDPNRTDGIRRGYDISSATPSASIFTNCNIVVNGSPQVTDYSQ